MFSKTQKSRVISFCFYSGIQIVVYLSNSIRHCRGGHWPSDGTFDTDSPIQKQYLRPGTAGRAMLAPTSVSIDCALNYNLNISATMITFLSPYCKEKIRVHKLGSKSLQFLNPPPGFCGIMVKKTHYGGYCYGCFRSGRGRRPQYR